MLDDFSKHDRWYAVHTRSRHEKKVKSSLDPKVAECFLPLLNVQSRRKDRVRFFRKPLIPGYLFVRDKLDSNLHLEILKTHGVVKILTAKTGSDIRPCPIPDEEIDSLKILLDSGFEVTPFDKLEIGEKVEVVSGPFMGAVGDLVRIAPNKNRLVVSINILNHSVAVDIDVMDVTPVK